MNNYARILVVLCTCLFISCKEEWQKAFEKADDSLLYHNDHQGWELSQEIKSEWDINYTIKKLDHDTTKLLFFLETKDGSIAVNEYKKWYPCGGVDTCYLEMTSQDTLFYYRQHNGEKIFEVGEYAYRFIKFRMDSTEANYYVKHMDSLRRVKGNNLPKLPNE